MQPTQISVVIPVRNDAAGVTALLDSLQAQLHEGIEVLVVDDASTDGTAEFVEAYASVRLLRHELCRGAAGGAQYSGRDGTRQGSAVHRRRYPR
jgi:glycosyltransferase involved in cell wall biosynthesis